MWTHKTKPPTTPSAESVEQQNKSSFIKKTISPPPVIHASNVTNKKDKDEGVLNSSKLFSEQKNVNDTHPQELPIENVQNRADTYVEKIWNSPSFNKKIGDLHLEHPDEAKITFFNGKKKALDLVGKLNAANQTLTRIHNDLQLQANENAELQFTLNSIRGMELKEVIQLIRSSRIKYDELVEKAKLQHEDFIESLNLQQMNMQNSFSKKYENAINVANNQLLELTEKTRILELRKTELQSEIVDLKAIDELQSGGYYDFEHPAHSSVSLGEKLLKTREKIKELQRNKKATTASSGFTFNNSEREGRKFVTDMSKLLLRSYNAEAENCIKSVKAGNLKQATLRLNKAKEQAEKLGSMINLNISRQFHSLRITEMELANSHLQALAADKETERENREQLRETKRVEDELARKKATLQAGLNREKEKYSRSIELLQQRGDLEAIARMEEEIKEIEKGIEDVDYRAANIKAGYVYIISNIGSFGEGIVKIGLTRRLNPLDRIKELSDASVPFKFDVHAIIFSDNAPALEASLHRYFEEVKVNKVNARKEFFYATPQAVFGALKIEKVEILEFVIEPEAFEWRASS